MSSQTGSPGSAVTGGCQCGAVRYALSALPTGAALCHCRMCQKATGGPFLAAAGLPPAQLAWTRGAPATFRSSSLAERGFCAACGTPLTFRYLDQDRVSVTLGSLDVPDAVPPTEQIGIEARLAWWPAVAGLPERTTEQDAPGLAARLADYQHPDHDTGDGWRPGGRRAEPGARGIRPNAASAWRHSPTCRVTKNTLSV